MELATQVQIMDEADSIPHHVNALGKGMNPSLLHSAMGKSSSSCHATNMDLPDPFSPPFSIIHRSWEVFQATSCISTKLLYIGSSWSSYLHLSR